MEYEILPTEAVITGTLRVSEKGKPEKCNLCLRGVEIEHWDERYIHLVHYELRGVLYSGSLRYCVLRTKHRKSTIELRRGFRQNRRTSPGLKFSFTELDRRLFPSVFVLLDIRKPQLTSPH